MQSKTLRRFATLLACLYTIRDDNNAPNELAPEVKNQVNTIEDMLYGLLDRLVFSNTDENGKPIFIDSKTAKAMTNAIAAVRENEGERGNAPERWYNCLTKYPSGTLDGVLKIERAVREMLPNGTAENTQREQEQDKQEQEQDNRNDEEPHR